MKCQRTGQSHIAMALVSQNRSSCTAHLMPSGTQGTTTAGRAGGARSGGHESARRHCSTGILEGNQNHLAEVAKFMSYRGMGPKAPRARELEAVLSCAVWPGSSCLRGTATHLPSFPVPPDHRHSHQAAQTSPGSGCSSGVLCPRVGPQLEEEHSCPVGG